MITAHHLSSALCLFMVVISGGCFSQDWTPAGTHSQSIILELASDRDAPLLTRNAAIEVDSRVTDLFAAWTILGDLGPRLPSTSVENITKTSSRIAFEIAATPNVPRRHSDPVDFLSNSMLEVRFQAGDGVERVERLLLRRGEQIRIAGATRGESVLRVKSISRARFR